MNFDKQTALAIDDATNNFTDTHLLTNRGESIFAFVRGVKWGLSYRYKNIEIEKLVSLLKRWYSNGDVEEDKDGTIFTDTIQILDEVKRNE